MPFAGNARKHDWEQATGNQPGTLAGTNGGPGNGFATSGD